MRFKISCSAELSMMFYNSGVSFANSFTKCRWNDKQCRSDCSFCFKLLLRERTSALTLHCLLITICFNIKNFMLIRRMQQQVIWSHLALTSQVIRSSYCLLVNPENRQKRNEFIVILCHEYNGLCHAFF